MQITKPVGNSSRKLRVFCGLSQFHSKPKLNAIIKTKGKPIVYEEKLHNAKLKGFYFAIVLVKLACHCLSQFVCNSPINNIFLPFLAIVLTPMQLEPQ